MQSSVNLWRLKFLVDQHQAVPILLLVLIFEDMAGKAQLAGGLVHVDAEQLIARAYLFGKRALLALLQEAIFTEVAAAYGTGQIISVKKSSPLDFQRCPGQIPGIVRMEEQDPGVAADDFNPLIEGGAPGAALEAVIAVAVTGELGTVF